MKKLKVEIFDGSKKDQELVDFINNNKIDREDILKIAYRSGMGLALYYYSKD